MLKMLSRPCIFHAPVCRLHPSAPASGRPSPHCQVVDGRTLLRDVSFYLPPGAILGVVGPNGTGKTTLFKILSRQLEPDAGTLIVGDTVKLGYVQQTRESLDAKNTIFDEIAQGSEYIPIGTHEQVRC